MSSLWPVEAGGDFSVPDFLESPLVHWAVSLSSRRGSDDSEDDGQGSSSSAAALSASDLCNTHFLKRLLDQIEPQLLRNEVIGWQEDPVLYRLTLLESLVTNLRTYFTEHLGQMMVMRPPDILFMCQFPGADYTVNEMRKLLLLILSFAVQSGRKEEIIERIQKMDEDVQKGIVECIKEVTDNPLRVWKVQLSDFAVDHEHDRHLLLTAQQHITNLLVDRHQLVKLALTLWRESYALKSATSGAGSGLSKLPASGSQAVEVADLKTHIRRVTQELYECQEELKECKEELKITSLAINVLREENGNLEKDARLVKVYRDELDILYEKDKATQKLESELSRYRGQLVELEYYKNRIEELEQNWKLLTDTKNLLEVQLESARKRTEIIPQLENDLCMMRHDLQTAVLQSNSHKDQVEDLLVANTQLSLELKRYRRHDPTPEDEEERAQDLVTGGSLSLSDQLHESLSTKVLRLEIENEQLRAADRCQDVQLSCRHCEKDSAIGTLHTSEDTSSTGESSVEAEERHLECDPGYDTIDYKYSTPPDAIPSRHLQSTEFLLNHVFDNSPALLREENFRLKEEVALLKTSVGAFHRTERTDGGALPRTERSPAIELRLADPSSEKLILVEDQLAKVQSEMSELAREKLRLETELAEEQTCVREICTFLRQHDTDLPHSTLSTAVGLKKAQDICDGISQAFSRKEKEAVERSHEEIINELESLKSEYEELRLAHDSDVRNLSAEHDAELTAQRELKKQETLTLQNDIRSLKMKHEKEVHLLTLKEEELLKKVAAEEKNLRCAHANFEGEKRGLLNELSTLRNASSSATSSTSPDADKLSALTAANQRLEAEVKSLRTCNSTLKRTVEEQEREKESLLKTTESSQAAHSTVMADHESLQHYHEQLNTDYEKLSREVARLKNDNKKMAGDLDDAKKKVVEGSAARTARDSDSVRVERLQRLEGEYEKLVAENELLRNSNRQLGTTYRVLTEEHKTVKTEVNQLKLKKIEYEGVVFDCQNQVYSKEIEANKHTEILLGIIASLEDEKRSFAAAIERLVLQYDDVFLHSWREKNEMKSEHKDLQEKLNALAMQKQLLIQKLYDTFKATEARKRNISFLKRMRRAAGELVGRSRSRDQSRNRTISPTDSAADSSSVESNGPSHDLKSGKTRNSASVHSFKTLQAEQNAPPLSYSSDDLRKQSSSASSSCISPTKEVYPVAREGTTPIHTDPAFHRVGSRRGVYRPHGNTAVVVHHPAIKQALTPPVAAEATSALQHPLRTERRVSLTDSVKSTERKKNCCSSYGGFHDCTMLNYTRLSATSALSNDSSSTRKLNASDRNGSLAGDRTSQSSSLTATPPPYHSPTKAAFHNRMLRECQYSPDSMATNMRTPPMKTSPALNASYVHPSNQTRFRNGADSGGSSPVVTSSRPVEGAPVVVRSRGDVAESLSSWSFSASFNTVSAPHSESASVTSSSQYYISPDGSGRYPLPAPPVAGSGVINGEGGQPDKDQIWFEYGCV